MRLFSEKVEPTFTSSNLNILTVKEFTEVFFDVFEFEINGKKFIAEKVADYRGFPVVDVPLVLEGKELTAPFVLQKGKFEILFNPDLATIVGEAVEESIEPLIDVTEKAEEIEEIVLEKKETILQEIAQAKQSAAKYVEKLKQQKLEEAAQYFEDKQKAFEVELQESKKGLLDEFLGLVENVKSEVFTFNQEEKDKLKTFIESSINHLSSKLSKSIDSKQESAEEKFSEQINELTNKVLSGVLLKEITRNNEKSTKDINTRFESISKSLETLVDNKSKLIIDGVSNTLNEFSETITTLEKANVEINDQINKTNNKALSRIGNVKTQLEESIIDTTNTLIEKIETAESRIKDYYDTKITLIEERVEGITDENKSYFIGLINESRQSLLNELSNIKVDVPNIVIEKANGKQEVDLKGIKTELEKVIGTRFSNELQSLKRLIEMSSGGGSVAKQFANGGTMDGNLTVIGTISAQSYAGIPNPDLTQYLPISGGTVTGNLTVNGTLSTTLLEALSANITVIDIKQYELSGFNVTGNATVQGSVSATGDLTVHKRLNFAGDANGANNLYFVRNSNNNWAWESNGVGQIMSIAGNSVTIGQDTTFTRQGITIRNLGETTGATLLGEAPDVLAQRRRTGTAAQEFRIYNTYTDAANYERGFFRWDTNTFKIGLSAAGTGVNRNLEFVAGGSTRMAITSSGRVGIGTIAPSTNLEITTASNGDGIKLNRSDGERVAWVIDEGAGNGALYLYNGSNSNTGYITGNGISFLNGGNLGIGTATPNEKLTVSGNISASGTIYSAGSAVVVSPTIVSIQAVTSSQYSALVSAGQALSSVLYLVQDP